MNKIFLILTILFSLVNFSKVYSADATPTSYINTVHSVMLCGTGSSETECLNPVLLGNEGTTGKSFDLSSVTAGASAGGIGSLSSVPYGTSFGWFQIILNRQFTVTATGKDTTDNDCATEANSGNGTASSTTAPAYAVVDGNAAAQLIKIPDGITLADNMNGTDVIDGTVGANEEPAGDPVDADTPYIKFRVQLTPPFILKPGKMPNVEVAFSLTNAVTFTDTNGATAGQTCGIFPNSPSVTIKFVGQ